uniref:Uncharacterized protein n=1 Tax=Anopheles atroparvus TaxID=41427 RepID=A0AAG5CYX1_ANOAO
MKSRFLLDVVIRKGATIFQLLAGEDETLLVWGDSFLILNLGLHVLNRIGRFHLQGDGFSRQGLDENLHSASQTQNQMESRFLLDVVIRKGATIFQLLAGEDETLLVWGDSFLILNLGLHVLNRIGRLHLQGDGFSRQGLDENLHSASQTQYQMESRFLLDVVIRKGATIFQLLAGEDETLLIWGDSFLILNLGLHVLNRIGRLHLQGDGFSRQGLDENLHSASQTQYQMESRFLLNVVIRKGATIFQLLAGEDETLLIWGDSFLILNLGLHVLNRIGRLHLQGDGFSRQGLDENLHSASQTQYQMESRFLLDVVIRKGATIFQLLAGEDETLLVWGDSFLILNLGLHVLNRIGRLHLQGDGFSRQGLDENLHSASQTQYQMESRFLLDVVIRKGATIFQLLAGEDETLLVWGDSFLILNLGLHVLNRIGRLHLQGDGFSRQGLDENLHSASQTQYQMESRFLLDVVIRKGATIFQLLAGEDETLLVWGDSFLILNLGLHVLNRIGRLHLQGDGFSRQGLDENL